MLLKNSWQKWMGLFITILLLLFLLCSSIVYGYTDTTWKMAIDAFTDFNGTNEHIVIQSVRLPRALIASAIGASLAISGVLMQTLTKNPRPPRIYSGSTPGRDWRWSLVSPSLG